MKHHETTIEFFTPKLGLDVTAYIAVEQKQGIHHVGRYQWACEVLKLRQPRRVLDIACGAGYGSFMMAQALPNAEIIGGDYDQRAIDYAKQTYQLSNLRYFQADVVTWKSSEEKSLQQFDAITSFDTIEHLLHREIALLRMAENLSDNGALLLSTPSGRPQSTLNPAWEHHKIEYSYSDLYSLLKRFFSNVIPPQHPDFRGSQVWTLVNDGALRYLNRMNPLICSDPIRVDAIRPEYIDVVSGDAIKKI
jgi:cyclopropane fatty-acyl-phospholipid synthase-like methyltransferase